MSKRTYLWILLGACILAGGFLSWTIYQTNQAHTTFEKYYAFRGCTELLERTDAYAYCRLASGKEIKIVLYNGGWYLDGDLPSGWGLTF